MSDFWARRKAAVLAEDQETTRLAEAEAQAEREASMAERTDEDILAELDLPDPDTLEEGDDFKAFLSEAVPARIRTRALRRLWRLNPILANVDGLVDYGDDFTDANCVVENLQTAYQVGKGMTEHVLELARRAEEAAAANDIDTLEDDPVPERSAPETETDIQDIEDKSPVLVAEATIDTGDLPQSIDIADDPDAFVPSRRMRFAFETPEGARKDAGRA
ncbi:DUF3306 domain-containing protein [Cognatishimia activa]|uniref:DUF3306 domain-containing protein n=1 Tax=Cognatishimia activa TaxID=1715691 RepID=A0A0P1ITM9_9RHOB|nr:DUF3306 domain-containing protein [Cognatishimia activa]CUJ36826.1 hypothetical protein TA5113_03196 [Cognatishimia activa]CUK26988.1 hypothetical protein TA5114_02807 [Cognatishimia activa]